VARLGIHRDFLQDLVRLEKPIQQKVVDALVKFEQATHTGAHLEKIQNVRDDRLKSIRIDLKYRGIVLSPKAGDQFTLLKVLPHDDAYNWAQRRKASVNAATGQIEIRDSVTIDTTAAELARTTAPAPERLFTHVSDVDLVRLGVDEQMRGFARLLTSIEPLEAIRGHLPGTQCDVLYALASGYTIAEVLDEIIEADPGTVYDPDDIAGAVERTPATVLLVDGPAELIELFHKPFAFWRVYLHPTQRQAAYGSFSGPAQVTGGPGTGKTVVALHRARHLAAHGGQVLLTTFTGTLVDSLLENLRLLENDPEILARIDVRTVDQVAAQIVREHRGRYAIIDGPDEQALWGRIVRRRGADHSETFIAEEWRQIILAQDLTTLDAYLAARRVGRGRRLGSLQRAQVWNVVSEFEQELDERGYRTYDTVCAEAARIMTAQEDKPYDHVVIDEAQDLHPVRWRTLRALVGSAPNDLFIAGDTHQRIYDNRVSLRSIGIPVAGRSTRLTINYRTTAEILDWSHAVLSGERIDDLDEGTATLAGLRSEVHGRTPQLVPADTKNQESALLVDKVRGWLSSGVQPGEIGIAARSGPAAQEAAKALRNAGIEACHLTRTNGPVDGQVQTMTMHRMKGLEFRCVAVIGVGEHQLPAPGSVRAAVDDELAHTHDLQRERCLLFVACTRAREDLHVSWHGAPSVFLP
jgi:hypothetical protein